MGHPIPLVPGVHLTDEEAKKLKALARKGVGIDKRAAEHRDKIAALEGSLRDMDRQLNDWKRSYSAVVRDRDTWKANYERLWAEVKDFIGAIRSAPQRLLAFLRDQLPSQKSREREGVR